MRLFQLLQNVSQQGQPLFVKSERSTSAHYIYAYITKVAKLAQRNTSNALWVEDAPGQQESSEVRLVQQKSALTYPVKGTGNLDLV